MAAAYVKLFTDYSETFEDLSDAEAGRLIKAVLHYGASGEKRTLSGVERIAFGIICRQMDRDREAREAAAEAHRIAGRRGGKPAVTENQTQPTITNQNQIGYTETKLTQEKDKDEDKEEDEKEKAKKERRRFTPPTLEEVQAYIAENGYPVDARRWMAHYESNGWMVGKVKMTDWRAAVRTWAHNDLDKARSKPAPTVAQNGYQQRDYSDYPRFEWLKEMDEDQAAYG